MKFLEPLSTRLTLIQGFLVLACVGFQPLKLSYWDSGWYRGLVNEGYSSTFPDGLGNVGFFPGYPLAASVLKSIFSFGSGFLTTDYALLLTAIIFSFLLWSFLKNWLQMNDQNVREIQIKLIFFALYPFSFFFYAAYSESMFTALVVAFICLSEKWVRAIDLKKQNQFLAFTILVGFGMCFTRLLGLTFIAYPLIRTMQTRRQIFPAIGIASLSLLGCISFFAFCFFKFGTWDFYFVSERAIWGTYFDWHKLFPPTSLFHFTPPFSGDTIGKIVTLVLGFFLTRKLWKLLKNKAYREPLLALVLVNGMYWGANLLGRTSWNYVGMGRYLLPSIALLLPWIPIAPKSNRYWFLLGTIFLILQIGYIITFAHHGWVA